MSDRMIFSVILTIKFCEGREDFLNMTAAGALIPRARPADRSVSHYTMQEPAGREIPQARPAVLSASH